ncbi:MAG: lipid-A-disaccharide synthase [SAR86 cluster bacterium]|uniref:Lipid-A-disaccharide synthase n=1 Tax=SAR86 cluster bacterium TaxID=2030880 RepID=A0A2A5C989_9GAMM|nr:MAG: lipid-A-disaccharide synthase [SAR86 cluster bacterium]
MSKTLRIGILAGESSGDILGAGLMQALKSQHSDISFEGIGGPLMEGQGLQSMVPMERLSVMGLIEPLKRLPELLKIRKTLIKYFLNHQPDVFIGIDSPDFNLNIERQLKQAGITTVHYVSPSVWAWRSKRIHKIARSVDLMLTLFPFEEPFYKEHKVAVCCVGHPLADLIPLEVDKVSAISDLGLNQVGPILALLPGSRGGEVGRLAPAFLECASLCLQHWPQLQIVIPCANAARKVQIEALLNEKFPTLKVTLIDGRSREVMAAAGALLIASGTATLEALLLKKPMLVCYKMSAVSYALISRMLKVPYFSLPNLLAGKKLVEERVQKEVNAPALFHSLQKLLEDKNKQEQLNLEYLQIHQSLRKNANARAAEAVLSLITHEK